MSKIDVRTKGNSSPQGKARVWFSCHPDDFGKYFEEICKDIFETQNCAVYYESERDADYDEQELGSQLSDMQLFVVIVTTDYLYKENRARTFEYGFAVKNHIPVLPIAVESGISSDFKECMNRIEAGYGDVQFLNRTSTDTTEIPYAEKLSKQLNEILVGDETAARVRAAFDAYIFLSYRKKDRAYAKELMRLIHRIPFCRDIAIWYDEFLKPGEGWNGAITEAMKKSSLVTLAVTPNLTESGNFIIRNEYPDAVKLGKEVVPAELMPTDRKLLSELFEGISMPVNGTDENAMTEALRKIAIDENNTDPEHNFLIGLAYLGGIDVERDNGHAVSLITYAAEAELPEAIRKLVSMYNTGDGVERDYHAAVQWQEKLVEVLEKAENPLKTDNLIWRLADLGDMWKALGQLKEAREAYVRMQQYAEARKNMMPASAEARRGFSASCERLGNLCMAEGDLKKARGYYEKDLEIFERLADETGTVEARRDLSVSCSKLGDLCRDEGDLKGARGYYEKDLEISEQLADETGTVEAYDDLAIAYIKNGMMDEDMNRIRKAYDILCMLIIQCPEAQIYVQLKEQLEEEYPSLLTPDDISTDEDDVPEGSLIINESNFPDPIFRTYLQRQFGSALSEAKISSITEINVSGLGVSSMKGIEFFHALTMLNCDCNELTELDVTQNIALIELHCSLNALTELNVIQNTALRQLHCFNNRLTALDVSRNTELTHLLCLSNQLTELDVSRNTALIALKCTGNMITSLDLSANTSLIALKCDESVNIVR